MSQRDKPRTSPHPFGAAFQQIIDCYTQHEERRRAEQAEAIVGRPPLFHGDGSALANRVVMKCRLNNSTGCWEWEGAKGKKGYGRMKVSRRLVLPHRVIAAAVGIIPETSLSDGSQYVIHTCDNPRCCNPEHLKAGSLSDNMKDCASKGRLHAQKMKREKARK